MSTSELRTRLQAALGASYTLERELGGGGMSRVFVASDATLGRSIVVKVLSPDLAADVSVARFQREIGLAARLQHPHIVPLLSTGEADGLPYYTMPFVDGESLHDRLTRGGELPVAEAVRLLRDVATALVYAHEKGIVHRDIKPQNNLLTGGIALVTDFGVAKAMIDATTVGRGTLTAAGVTVGTPAYMSPEQVSADPGIDHRADIYSFGVVAYELLSGQPPFSARTTQALLAAHVVERPESLAVRRPAVPAALAALVMRCLEKRPADRPQSAAEIVRSLDALTAPASSTSAAAANTKRWIVRARLPGLVVLTALTVGAAWFALQRGGRAPAAHSSRLLITPLENLTGDPRFDYVGRIAADRLTFSVAQNGSIDVVPTNIVLMALRDTAGGSADHLKRLSGATHAGLLASGSVALRRDSLVFQVQVSDMQTGNTVVTLEPVAGSAADPIAAVDALGDRLLGALGRRRWLSILPQGYRAPKYAAYREFAAGFERFAEHGDVVGSRPFFERAIAIDSTYTQAYQLLARQYINAGEYARADSMMRRIKRLPGGLTETEQLTWDYARAELDGNLSGLLRAAERLAAQDSSALSLFLVGEAATMLLEPKLAVRVLESAKPTYDLMGGRAALLLRSVLAEAEHEAGAHDSEMHTLVAAEREFAFAAPVLQGRRLRAYAGLKSVPAALALADSMLRDADDSTGGAAMRVATGAQEFRAHGDPVSAKRLLTLVSAWRERVPVRRRMPARDFAEAIAMLMGGMADSAAV
ncbi:MAG TPA: protein kinase, partial [Gemmatimonadaceae bacterium]|nr:protein kinase [Gemmatimonadaceae bacterium]